MGGWGRSEVFGAQPPGQRSELPSSASRCQKIASRDQSVAGRKDVNPERSSTPVIGLGVSKTFDASHQANVLLAAVELFGGSEEACEFFLASC